MKKFFASKLGKAALIAGAAVVVALVAVVLVVVLRPEEAYRSITVGEVSGQAYVQREGKSDVAAYAGMALFDGDTVRVSADSHMTVVLDGDKHMLAEAGTAFSLEASGKPGSDRTVITLLSGGMLTRLENKLEGEQSYVVQTPTSTIAVRGTVFYVRIELDGNGIPTVHHQVLDGEIEVNPSGDEEQTVLVGAGFSVSVREDGENGIIVRDGNGELIGVIAYESMSAVIIRELLAYLADGETLVVDEAFLQNLLSPPKHEHQYGAWTSASDTEHKQVCECGESKTNPHNWNAGEVTKEPTHTVEGVKTFTCTDCEHIKTESVPVTTAHTYGAWISVSDTEHKQVCECGESKTNPHNWNAGEVTKEPTHTVEGEKTFTCTDCEHTKTESIPVTTAHTYGAWTSVSDTEHKQVCECGDIQTADHNWNAGEITKEPTHTVEGVKTFTCTDCEHTKTEPVPVTTAHTYGAWGSVSDTEHKQVCECGDIQTADHNWNAGEVTKEPTHTVEGEKTFTCTDCEHTKTESVPVTTAHTYGAWVSVSDTEHKQVCECGDSKATPHNWNAGEITKEPTHTVEGVKTFTCTDCEHTKTESVPVTEDHTFAGEWYAGQTGHYQRCAGCGAASEELAHSGGEANCQAQAVCALCHTAYGSYGGHVSSEAWRPSATDGNSHEKYCVLCGTVWSTAPHDWWGEGVVTTPATHMSVGVKTFTCTDCGAARTESIPKITAHEWSRWAVDPTNEDGHMRTCPCGAVERGGHTYGAGVDGTAPNGTPTTVYSCTACMHERFAYKDVLPPTGLNGLFAVDGTAYGDWSSAALALSNDSSAKVTYLLQDIWDYDFSSLFGPVSLPYDNDAFLGGDRPQIPTFTDAGTAVDVPAFYAMTWDLYGHGIRLGAAPRIHEGATWTIRATGGGMMATEGYGLNCFDMGGLLDGTVVILGGMFDFDPTEYVPAGYTVRMVLAPDFFAGTDWDAPTEDYAALIDRFGTYSALINAGNAGTDVYQCRQPGLWIVFAEGSEPAVCDHNVFRACVTVDGVPYDYCSACGETVEHRHNPLWDSYDTEHSQYCIICYETLVEWEAHTLDEGVPGVNDFGEDVMIHHCTVCGRDVVRVLCDGNHIYDRGVESTDGAGNPISLHTCIRCDATTVYTAHACEPDWEHMLYNGNYHWYPCTTEGCPAKIYYEEHSYEEDMIVVAPTHDTLGVRATGCFCGHYIAGTESPVEFTGLYIHFDKDCGQPDWSLYADNEMPVTDAFDPARIKVYGLYSDSFDPDSGEVLLTADGTPVYGRLLDPSEYELEYYHCADPDGYASMRPSTAADATLAGEHLVYVRLLKADGKPDRAHWESFGYTVYVGELEVY